MGIFLTASISEISITYCRISYQSNMELIASVNSTIFVLSMQHVPTQAYSNPTVAAFSQIRLIFRYLAEVPTSREGFCISWKVTSRRPHRCDRIAYAGTVGLSEFGNVSSLSVVVLSSRIVAVYAILTWNFRLGDIEE